jgi:hypothetical protein
VALLNEQRTGLGKGPIGDLAPDLYQISPAAFRDITPITQGTAVSGQLNNNGLFQYNADGSVSFGPVAGWPTISGWDMTTGLGSPWAPTFISELAALP